MSQDEQIATLNGVVREAIESLYKYPNHLTKDALMCVCAAKAALDHIDALRAKDGA